MSSGLLLNMYMNIFCNDRVSEYFIRKLNQESFHIYTDIESFLSSTGEKCSVINLLPFNYKLNQHYVFLDDLIRSNTKIILISSELNFDVVDFVSETQSKLNCTSFINGFIPGVETKFWPHWFHSTSIVYKENPDILAPLTPYAVKPKVFDILLGRLKPHRDFVHDFISYNGLKDQVVMTYFRRGISIQEQPTDGYILEENDYELPDINEHWPYTTIKWRGHGLSISQVIPVSIYNQTAYSIVAETIYDNRFAFFTEKIVKPILAERLFLVFSGKHYLKHLRDLGFKTFDGIIDESYDEVDDTKLRYCMIYDQMRYLFAADQKEILEKIRPITEYNKQLMLETEWQQDFFKDLTSAII